MPIPIQRAKRIFNPSRLKGFLMYKHILCPIDGTVISNRGLKEAIMLAKDQHTQLRLLHVIDTYFPVLDGMGDLMITNITDMFRKNANKVVKQAKVIAEKAGIKVEIKLLETLGVRVAALIVQEANAWASRPYYNGHAWLTRY